MKHKYKGHSQSTKTREACIKNFDIYRLRGMIAALNVIKTRDKDVNLTNYETAKITINNIIRNLKNVSN